MDYSINDLKNMQELQLTRESMFQLPFHEILGFETDQGFLMPVFQPDVLPGSTVNIK